MRAHWNCTQITIVLHAVHVRRNRSLEGRDGIVVQRLPPNIEEHSERKILVGRSLPRSDIGRFDMDDAACVVRVNPVETAAGEVWSKPNKLRNLHLLAVVEDREMAVNVKRRVLHFTA